MNCAIIELVLASSQMLIAQACMCSQGRWKLADAWITCLAHGHGAASCRCTRSHQFLAFHRWLHSSRGRGSCNMQMPSEKWRRRSHAMQQPPAAYTLQAYGSAPRGAYRTWLLVPLALPSCPCGTDEVAQEEE
jgi:hypothetical protein